MRILLTNDRPIAGCGSGTTVLELERALAAAGHEVRCLAAECDLAAAPDETEFIRLRESLRRQLDALVEAFNPHLIHAQHAGVLAHLALESGVPYVITAHSLPPAEAASAARLLPLAEQAAENAGAILTHTEHLARQLRTLLAGAEVPIVALAPGIEIIAGDEATRTRASVATTIGVDLPSGPLVALVGALGPTCGAATLLNAAAVYEQLHPSVQTLIAGDGPLAAELRAQAARLALSRVQFAGMLPRGACRVLVATADLAVVPACGAPATWAVLEALAAGTPVVASSGEGRDEHVAEEFGALVPPDDHEHLAETVLRALAEDWKRSKGPRAVERVRAHHDPARWAARTLEIYERVVHERGGWRP